MSKIVTEIFLVIFPVIYNLDLLSQAEEHSYEIMKHSKIYLPLLKSDPLFFFSTLILILLYFFNVILIYFFHIILTYFFILFFL